MKSLVILMFFGAFLTPAAASAAVPPAVVQEAPARPAATDLVDLNTATPAQLEALPGIGPAMARRIVEHREKNGPFAKLEDLMQVKGIGEKAFLRLRPLLTVGKGAARPAQSQS